MKQKTIYALGFFDGVHLGHGALLTACHRLAQEHGCEAGVVTFSDHPDALVLGKAPKLISSLPDRDWLLREKFHMDRVISLPFDRAMLHTPWEVFYETLREEYGAGGIVCGEDFRFGRRGEGSGDKLLVRCAADGIPCQVIPSQELDGQVISSTDIRELLAEGQMERAVQLLGHPHILSGTVVPGYQLGRTLGVPTANLRLPPELVTPRFGVYACLARVEGTPYPAVTNIGTRPTVDGTGVTVEPWLLDFQGDLYGKQIRLEFYKFLRPERKFPDLDALKVEIQRNASQTRAFFEQRWAR